MKLNMLLFLATVLLSACNHSLHETTLQDNRWRIGAKIHFEEESGPYYIGTKEINKLTRDVLKSTFAIKKERCENNAKILLKKENGDIQIDHYVEKIDPSVGEKIHATLLYTTPRNNFASESLIQICPILFENHQNPPTIDEVVKKYHSIIQPSWHFKISAVSFIKNDKGAYIVANLLFNGKRCIYKDGKPISAWLHMTLINCPDSSILSDPIVINKLIKKLNEDLKGKFIKIASKNDVVDLEFGVSGQYGRIRSGQKVEFKKLL